MQISEGEELQVGMEWNARQRGQCGYGRVGKGSQVMGKEGRVLETILEPFWLLLPLKGEASGRF